MNSSSTQPEPRAMLGGDGSTIRNPSPLFREAFATVPELALLIEWLRRLHNASHDPTYCSSIAWYGGGEVRRGGLRGRARQVAGIFSGETEEEWGEVARFDAVHNTLHESLPVCNDRCSCKEPFDVDAVLYSVECPEWLRVVMEL